MKIILEVLTAVAALATIAGFILDRWEKYKCSRMTKGDIEKTDGNRS